MFFKRADINDKLSHIEQHNDITKQDNLSHHENTNSNSNTIDLKNELRNIKNELIFVKNEINIIKTPSYILSALGSIGIIYMIYNNLQYWNILSISSYNIIDHNYVIVILLNLNKYNFFKK